MKLYYTFSKSFILVVRSHVVEAKLSHVIQPRQLS